MSKIILMGNLDAETFVLMHGLSYEDLNGLARELVQTWAGSRGSSEIHLVSSTPSNRESRAYVAEQMRKVIDSDKRNAIISERDEYSESREAYRIDLDWALGNLKDRLRAQPKVSRAAS